MPLKVEQEGEHFKENKGTGFVVFNKLYICQPVSSSNKPFLDGRKLRAIWEALVWGLLQQ